MDNRPIPSRKSKKLLLGVIGFLFLTACITGLAVYKLYGINQSLWKGIANRNHKITMLEQEKGADQKNLARLSREVKNLKRQKERQDSRLADYRERDASFESTFNNVELFQKLGQATVQINLTIGVSGLEKLIPPEAMTYCHGGISVYKGNYQIITAAHCLSLPIELPEPLSITHAIISFSKKDPDSNDFFFDPDMKIAIPIQVAQIFEEVDLAIIPLPIEAGMAEVFAQIALPFAEQIPSEFDPLITTRRYNLGEFDLFSSRVLFIKGIEEAPLNFYYKILGTLVAGESGSIAINRHGQIVGILSMRSLEVSTGYIVGFNTTKARLARLYP